MRAEGEQRARKMVPSAGAGHSESDHNACALNLDRRCVDDVRTKKGGGYVDEETEHWAAGEVFRAYCVVMVMAGIRHGYQGRRIRDVERICAAGS